MEQSSVPAQGQGQTPPGWYKDPTTGNDRYWDGQQWSQQEVKKSAVGGLEIAGYITAVLFSIAGLIIGIIVTARGNTTHGVLIMLISVVSMILGFVLVYG